MIASGRLEGGPVCETEVIGPVDRPLPPGPAWPQSCHRARGVVAGSHHEFAAPLVDSPLLTRRTAGIDARTSVSRPTLAACLRGVTVDDPPPCPRPNGLVGRGVGFARRAGVRPRFLPSDAKSGGRSDFREPATRRARRADRRWCHRWCRAYHRRGSASPSHHDTASGFQSVGWLTWGPTRETGCDWRRSWWEQRLKDPGDWCAWVLRLQLSRSPGRCHRSRTGM